MTGSIRCTYESQISYTWDLGNRAATEVDSLAGTITRHYDGLDDLTQEITPPGTVNYSYDNAGRRATMQVVGQSQVAYTWDNANRLTAVAQGSQSVGLNYDNANRRTCLSLPNGVIATYDSDSRVTSLTYGTGGSCSSTPPPSNLGSLTYSYDANGRRTATAGSLGAVTLPASVTGGTSTVYNADNEQVVADNKYLSEEDPHLQAREYFVYLEHPEVGVKQHAGIPWKMSRTECKVRGPAPLMGQHNDEVLTGLLGYSADEVAQMRARGALD